MAVLEDAGGGDELGPGKAQDDVGRSERPVGKRWLRTGERIDAGPCGSARGDPAEEGLDLDAVESVAVVELTERRIGVEGRHALGEEDLLDHAGVVADPRVPVHGPGTDAAGAVALDAVALEDGSDLGGVIGRGGGGDGGGEGNPATAGRGRRAGHGGSGEELVEGLDEVVRGGLWPFGPLGELVVDGALVEDAMALGGDEDGLGGPFHTEGEGEHLVRVAEVGEGSEAEFTDFGRGIGEGVVGVGVDDPEPDSPVGVGLGEVDELAGILAGDGAPDAGEEEDDRASSGAVQFDVAAGEVEEGEVGGGPGGIGGEDRGEPRGEAGQQAQAPLAGPARKAGGNGLHGIGVWRAVGPEGPRHRRGEDDKKPGGVTSLELTRGDGWGKGLARAWARAGSGRMRSGLEVWAGWVRRAVGGVVTATVPCLGLVPHAVVAAAPWLESGLVLESVEADGRPLTLPEGSGGGLPLLRLPAGVGRVEFVFGSVEGADGPVRVRHRLRGVDADWQESGGEMRLSLLAFNVAGDVVGLFESPMRGRSAGWRGTVADSVFTERHERVQLPPGVTSLRIVFSSGTWDARDGASHEALGIAILDDCRMWLTPGGGGTVELIADPACERGEAMDTVEGTPEGMVRGGIGPRMAQVLRLPEGPQGHVLALVDDNARSGGEWRRDVRLPEGLETGVTLWMEWKELYSVGAAGLHRAAYGRLEPGRHVFEVSGMTPRGVPLERGFGLAVEVPEVFWRTPWFRIPGVGMLLVALGAGVRGWTRRRLRLELEQLERERLVERERARIARDLHDDLGTGLTQITHLARGLGGTMPAGSEAAEDLGQIGRTAEGMTRALEEIVWAVDPKHDTVDGVAAYVAAFAQEFVPAAGMACRLDLPADLPCRPVAAEVRHHLFLGFKEALNNAVRHSGATGIMVRLAVSEDRLVLEVEDNGRGWDGEVRSRPGGGRGMQNLRERVERIGGRVTVSGGEGRGTRVRLEVALTDGAGARRGIGKGT